MTAFSWRMAVRETRAGWRHFLYFFFCIALGVGALVSVSLFATNVEQAVSREARSLLGGDLEVRSSRALSPEGEAVLASLKARGITSTHVSELVAMAASASAKPSDRGHTQLVELKAVGAGYPWYGEVRVDPALPLLDLLTAQVGTGRPVYGAVVQDSLLIRLGLEVGDRLT
ncbi:MAG: ABC transporter permease, partial [Nitrospirales bacterium]